MIVDLYLKYAGNKTTSIFAILEAICKELIKYKKERWVFS